MTKTTCDICNKKMPTAKFTDKIEDLNFCISSYGRIWDICAECRESLNRWMTIRRQKGEMTEEGIDRRETDAKNERVLSDYTDMPYQFDNMTGSMNL